MRITITAEGGQPVTLCDHGREGPSGLTIVPIRKVDVLEFVQGTYAKPKNRGNTLNQLTFTVSKGHADARTAQLYLFRLNETVPMVGTLDIELEDFQTHLIFLNATVELSPFPPIGCLTTISYTIKFGAVSEEFINKILLDSDGARVVTSDGKQIYTKESL
jgi:hypothetical protein